ncbi:MAG: hypothetical protein ACRD5D_00830 [Candidatus Polarisedimenticolia bacterium]
MRRPSVPSLAFVCDRCDRPIRRPIEGPIATLVCPACGAGHPVHPGSPPGPGAALQRCRRCGLDRLYVQKDFNRRIGLWVFVVAAVLSVPTWGLSLLAATLVDLGLYCVLGDVTLCYGCGTQHRGFGRNPAHGPFDLHVAESVDRRPTAA